MEEHKKVYCMFPAPPFPSQSLKSHLYSFYNHNVRILGHDPNSMESCHEFVFFISFQKSIDNFFFLILIIVIFRFRS